jgi:hypothetical protein
VLVDQGALRSAPSALFAGPRGNGWCRRHHRASVMLLQSSHHRPSDRITLRASARPSVVIQRAVRADPTGHHVTPCSTGAHRQDYAIGAGSGSG